MVGQWLGKARRMAADFQGQFNEAMREAEMADIKKQFDDVSAAAKDMSPTNLLASMNKDVEDAMKIDPPTTPTTPEPPTPATFAEAEAHAPPAELPPPTVSDAKAS